MIKNHHIENEPRKEHMPEKPVIRPVHRGRVSARSGGEGKVLRRLEILRSFRLLALFLITAVLTAALTAGCGGNTGASQDRETVQVQQTDADGNPLLNAVFFDVGKGDCILVSMGDSHILIDAGYEETSDKMVGELRTLGVDALDAMIVTHYDKDHVGGAAEIAQEIPVGTFYLPDYVGDADKCGDLLDMIRKEGLEAVRVSEDTSFSLQDAEVRVGAALVSYDPAEKNDNDASLIVEIIYGEDEWLLPGDIERDAIEVWLEGRQETFDVLKLPHHGKKEKNTKDLIESGQPEIAVITDSEEEDASKKVLKGLEEEGAAVYRSSVNGTIVISGNGAEDYQVTTEKQ